MSSKMRMLGHCQAWGGGGVDVGKNSVEGYRFQRWSKSQGYMANNSEAVSERSIFWLLQLYVVLRVRVENAFWYMGIWAGIFHVALYSREPFIELSRTLSLVECCIGPDTALQPCLQMAGFCWFVKSVPRAKNKLITLDLNVRERN
jgi:hypothetical protein